MGMNVHDILSQYIHEAMLQTAYDKKLGLDTLIKTIFRMK